MQLSYIHDPSSFASKSVSVDESWRQFQARPQRFQDRLRDGRTSRGRKHARKHEECSLDSGQICRQSLAAHNDTARQFSLDLRQKDLGETTVTCPLRPCGAYMLLLSARGPPAVGGTDHKAKFAGLWSATSRGEVQPALKCTDSIQHTSSIHLYGFRVAPSSASSDFGEECSGVVLRARIEYPKTGRDAAATPAVRYDIPVTPCAANADCRADIAKWRVNVGPTETPARARGAGWTGDPVRASNAAVPACTVRARTFALFMILFWLRVVSVIVVPSNVILARRPIE